MRVRHLYTAAIMYLLVVGDFTYSKSPPKDGYVPDADTAIKIAVVVWSRIYGEREIAEQKPYRASLKDGVWTVQGSFPQAPSGEPAAVGGVADAEIAQADGRILRIGHGE
jgi:hypothetical protein